MASNIHPTAIIDPKAQLADEVEIGPFVVIEAGVTIGKGTRIAPYVHIQGETIIGEGNQIGTGCTLGHAPQHGAYKGEPRRLRIGNHNIFREYVSVHRAYEEGNETRIGDHCFFMGFTHVAHDCHLGNRVTLANTAIIAGHCELGDNVFMSGLTGIHQFCRVGRLSILGGASKITRDVPPFMMAVGNPATIRGLNKVGLRRAGWKPDQRLAVGRVLHQIYESASTVTEAIAALAQSELTPEGRELVEFYTGSKRGISAFAGSKRQDEPGLDDF